MFPSTFPNLEPHPQQPHASIPMADTTSSKKVAIPRLAPSTAYRARRRSTRACETCRLRKTKCDGTRPSCGQCVAQNNKCVYEDIKRVRDQKLLGLLSKRTEEYESLLRDLEGRVDGPTARKIRKALKVSSHSFRSGDARLLTPFRNVRAKIASLPRVMRAQLWTILTRIPHEDPWKQSTCWKKI